MILFHIYSSVAVFQAYTLIRSNQRIWALFYYTALISNGVLQNEIHLDLHNLTPRHFSASPRCFHFPWLKTASWLRAPRCRQTWELLKLQKWFIWKEIFTRGTRSNVHSLSDWHCYVQGHGVLAHLLLTLLFEHSSVLLWVGYRFLRATDEFTFCYSNIFHQHSVWSRASFLKSKSYFFCSGLSVKAVGSMEELSAQFLVMFVAICKHLKSLQHKEKWKGFHSEGTGFLVWRPVFCGCSCFRLCPCTLERDFERLQNSEAATSVPIFTFPSCPDFLMAWRNAV